MSVSFSFSPLGLPVHLSVFVLVGAKQFCRPFGQDCLSVIKTISKIFFFPTSLSWSDTFTKSWQLFSVAFIKSVCWYNENHSHKVQCFMCSSRDFYYKMRSKILRNEQIIFMSTLCGKFKASGHYTSGDNWMLFFSWWHIIAIVSVAIISTFQYSFWFYAVCAFSLYIISENIWLFTGLIFNFFQK